MTPMTIPLLVLILSHFYMIKPEEDPNQAMDDYGIPREPFLIPGMPLLNNTAQLLEWTGTCLNGLQSLWRDISF